MHQMKKLPTGKNSNNRFVCMAAAIIMLCLMSGCYGKITGTVVDAETGRPIEGAVVLAEWTKTHGIGDHQTEVYKVIEKLTDSAGKVTLEGVPDILIAPPGVTVYKKGYVAWNNEYVFPDNKKRTDFKWKDGYVFKLEKFKPEYSYIDHQSFVYSAINSTIGGASEKQLFLQAYSSGEENQIILERSKRDEMNMRGDVR